MELVSGTPLTQYAAGRRVRGTAEPLTLRARLELLARVVEAVQHAHQKPVIHRDLKPDNILVTDEGQPKVLDFGLARVSADESGTAPPAGGAVGGAANDGRPPARGDAHTAAGGGTLAYMSPEQTRGDPAGIDIRTDVYTLGVIAYELLAGRLPYGLPRERHRLGEAFRIIQTVMPPPLAGRRASSTARAAWRVSSSAGNGPRQGQPLPDMSTLVASYAAREGSPARATVAPEPGPVAVPSIGPRFPDDVEAIVARAMRKEREERYASAGALAADIRRCLADEPVEAHPRFRSRRYQVAKLTRRNPALVGGVAATLLTLVIGGVASFALYLRAERNAAAAVRESAKWRSATELVERTFAIASFGNIQRDVRFSDVLAQLRREAEQVARDQPEVAVTAFRTLGTTYQMTGRLAESAAAFQRSVDLLSPLLGDDHPEVVIDRCRIGIVELSRGRYADALPVVESMSTILRSHRATHPDYFAEAVVALALIRAAQGERENAVAICHEALDALDPNNERHRDERGVAWATLGEIAFGDENWEGAVSAFREALPLLRAAFGEFGHYTLVATNNLAQSLFRTGQPEPARGLFVDLAAAARSKVAENPSGFVDLVIRLDAPLGSLEEHALADALLREAVTTAEASLGDSHVLTAEARNALALRLCRGDGLATREALDLLRAAAPVLEREWGADHPRVLLAKANLGRALIHQNRMMIGRDYVELTEARALLESLVVRLETLGPRPDIHVSVWELALDLTTAYNALDLDAPRALEFARVAVARAGTGASFDAFMRRCQLVLALARAGDFAEAEAACDSVARDAAAALPADPDVACLVRLTLSKLRLTENRHAEAEAALREAEGFLRDCPPGDPERLTPVVRDALAELYERWHLVEPAAGHDARAAAQRAPAPSP